MNAVRGAAPVTVGLGIPALRLPPLDAAALQRYAEASGDHAPVHLDRTYAQSMGFPDVIAHGLLIMASLGRVLTDWQEQRHLQAFSCRFVAVCLPGDELLCTGTVVALRDQDGECLADLDLQVRDQRGEEKIRGHATVAIAPDSSF